MTQAGNIHNHLIHKAYGHAPSEPYGKAYGTDFSKNLGGNNELAAYYENELLPYWQAVQSGEIQVSPQELSTLQQWMSYCQYELGAASSAWGDTGTTLPGQTGPLQNQNITDGGEFTVDGSCPTTDVWGDEAMMNVPPPCSVTFESTTDNRFAPPETVVKAIVTNPTKQGPDGQPAQSVVYFHDGVQITCNASLKGDGTSRATDSTGTVTIGEYKPGEAEGATPECSIEGEYDAETNTYSYDGTGQDVIKFWPQASGTEGEVTTHFVEGSVDIYVKNSDRVYVYEKDGNWVTDVVHDDGSVSRILQDKATGSYTANINGVPEHIFFGSDENHEGGTNPKGGKIGDFTFNPELQDDETEVMQIPEEFAEHFSVNGEETIQSSQEPLLPLIGTTPLINLDQDPAGDYPGPLVNLADFLYGNHDESTLDSLMTKLEAELKWLYDDDMLGKSAAEKIPFSEWIQGAGAKYLNPGNGSVIKFLFKVDPTLAALMEQVKNQPISGIEDKLQAIQAELAGLLNGMFGAGTASPAKGIAGGNQFDGYPVYGLKIGDSYFSFYEVDQGTGMGMIPKMDDHPRWNDATEGVFWE